MRNNPIFRYMLICGMKRKGMMNKKNQGSDYLCGKEE